MMVNLRLGPRRAVCFRPLAIRHRGARLRAAATSEGTRTMASKPTARTEYVLFNVYYEDGSQRSNRRVPAELLGGIDGDEPARKLVEEQAREISDTSGTPPLRIQRIVRVDNDVKQQARNVRRANERRASR